MCPNTWILRTYLRKQCLPFSWQSRWVTDPHNTSTPNISLSIEGERTTKRRTLLCTLFGTSEEFFFFRLGNIWRDLYYFERFVFQMHCAFNNDFLGSILVRVNQLGKILVEWLSLFLINTFVFLSFPPFFSFKKVYGYSITMIHFRITMYSGKIQFSSMFQILGTLLLIFLCFS